MNIACLTPDTDVLMNPGSNGSFYTSTLLLDTNSTVTVDTTAPTATSSTDSVSNSVSLSKQKRRTRGSGSPNSSFCLIKSYSWVGSDIIRPDCPDETATTSNGTSQFQDPTDAPPENERIANLYPDSLLCSEAEIPDLYKYFHTTIAFLMSPILRTSSSNDVSAFVARSQALGVKELSNLTLPDPTANCTIYGDAISNLYNVTTGDLKFAFDNYFCLPTLNFTSVCVLAGCTMMQVLSNATWFVPSLHYVLFI